MSVFLITVFTVEFPNICFVGNLVWNKVCQEMEFSTLFRVKPVVFEQGPVAISPLNYIQLSIY
jgi:hypothetical protein